MQQRWFDDRFICIFGAAFIALICSKGLALVPGFSNDEYRVIHSYSQASYLLSQGRFTHAAILDLLSILDLNGASVSFPSTVLCLLSAAMAIAAGLLYVVPATTDRFGLASAAALIGAHPYLTEYFAFRESMLGQAIAFLLLATTFWLVRRIEEEERRPLSREVANIALVVAVLTLIAGLQQTTYVVFSLFFLARVCIDIIENKRISLIGALPVRTLVALLASGVVYVLSFSLIRYFVVIDRIDPRATFIDISGIATRFDDVATVIRRILWDQEPILPSLPKACIFSVALLCISIVTVRNVKAALLIVSCFTIMVIGSIFLVSVSAVWWPVPRAIYGVGFALGIGFSLLLAYLPQRIVPLFSAAIGLAAVTLSFYSSAMLNDQLRLNRWDMWTAGEIARDLARLGVGADNQVILVGATWNDPFRLSTTEGDLNVSAFAVPYATNDLMMEATGRQWHVAALAQADVCRGSPAWPNAGAFHQENEKTYVCMRSL